MTEKQVIEELCLIISFLAFSVDMGNDDRDAIHERLCKIQNEYLYKGET